MSSNTQIRIRMVDVSGQETVSLDRVLGAGGTQLLRETLEDLPEIRKKLGGPAGPVANALDWAPVAGERSAFRTTVDGGTVTLRLGEALASVEITARVGATGASAAEVAAQLQRRVNFKVNQLLAVAMQRRVATRLAQFVTEPNLLRLPMKQRETVRQRVAERQREREMVRVRAENSGVLRTSAYYVAPVRMGAGGYRR